MQNLRQLCIWSTFWLSYAKYAQDGKCILYKHLCRYCAYIMQTFIGVCNWAALFWSSVTIFPYCALVLRGAEGMDPCWLLPGALTGREAGRPRVVWLIRSWRRAQMPHQMAHLTWLACQTGQTGGYLRLAFWRRHSARSRTAVRAAF